MVKGVFFENHLTLLRNLIASRKTPVYVQYYVTAKCNLRCQQCNIIYSNPGHAEMDLDRIEKTARNLGKIGTAIVLLTGGEPFAHKELPEIVKIFVRNKIHVRIQTNGYASYERIKQCVDNGAHDISISLDSLNPVKQEFINGDKKDSWHAALEAAAHVTQAFPKRRSFASFGCVLTPFNIADVCDVVEFAKRISWHVSLVPIHVMRPHDDPHFEKRLFAQKFSDSLLFNPEQMKEIAALIERLKQMKKSGYPLYDSDVFLDDIIPFIEGKTLGWRSKNNGVCDAPSMYFAVRPNGGLAPCCEYNVKEPIPVYDDDFPAMYRDRQKMKPYEEVAQACSGCMYGSYPEITTAIRFLPVALERARIFLHAGQLKKNWPLTYEKLLATAEEIVREKEKPSLVTS